MLLTGYFKKVTLGSASEGGDVTVSMQGEKVKEEPKPEYDSDPGHYA